MGYILTFLIGGLFGFTLFAVLTVNRFDDRER